jgi:Rrf2 family nitric oxide-sensitive transcriptional repressor
MKLTSYTDYTLRVLMYLALHPERLSTIPEIAHAYDISESHLTKVVHQLAKTGDVESVRGKRGGIRLARPAADIRIGEVVRLAEGEAPIVACFEAKDRCRIAGGCKLAGVLAQGFEALFKTLNAYSLADLTAQPASLTAVLRPGPAPATTLPDQRAP